MEPTREAYQTHQSHLAGGMLIYLFDCLQTCASADVTIFKNE